jgi:hypothetical protein
MHRISQGLRVIVLGTVPSAIRNLCCEVDRETMFLGAPSDMRAALTERVSPDDAVLVVSTTLNESDCHQIIVDEAQLPEPSCLGFVVNPDPSFVESWLHRLCGPRPEPTAGKSLAFLDQDLVGHEIAAVEDVRGAGASAQQAAVQAQNPLGSALLFGHSNGQCHGAGGVAICQRDRHNPRHTEEHQLPCFGNVSCRFDGGDAYVRVSTDKLQMEVVIDFTCFGYVLGDHTLLAKDGVGKGMLENSRLHALVSSLRAFKPNRHDYRLAAYLAHDGCEMGRLAMTLNRARVRELGEDAEFLCFGDPRARLAASVLAVGETSEFQVTVTRPDGTDNKACDLSIRMKPAQEEIMVFSKASSAAWSPDGTVYVTLPEGQASARLIRFPTDAARMTISFEPLIPHLDFLEHYLAALTEHPLAAKNTELAQALTNAESTRRKLRRMGLTFHPTSLRCGSVFDGNVLANLDRHRSEQLKSLSKNLLTVHWHTLTARSLLFLAGVETLRAITPQRPGPECAYCGADTTHSEKGVAGTLYKRTAAFCNKCGRLFEGAGFATVIDVESSGRDWEVRVPVVNGFPFDVPVYGVAAIQTFDGRNKEVSEFEPIFLRPDQKGELRTHIRVPDDVPPGMHRAKAAITVGPQVELLLRNYLIRPE